MIPKKTLKQIIENQKSRLVKTQGIARELEQNIMVTGREFIKIISGIRRCGKSTLMRQILSKTDYSLFINFEDPRLSAFEMSDYTRLDDLINEMGIQNIFFDEIQVIPAWERYIRGKHDEGLAVFLTGSNASLLSRELGSKLTGRHLTKELFPFSYNEFLSFKNKNRDAASFNTYLKKGGFPEFLNYDDDEILYQIFYDILYRDITVRYGIKRHETLKQMAFYLMSNTSKLMSYNQLRKIFSFGSTNTAVGFVSYYLDSYLMFTVPKFDHSLKKQMINPRKIFSIDTGLAAVNSLSFSEDRGRMLENAVFLALRRKYKQIYYYRNNHECDFIVMEMNAIIYAIQVCYELNEDNIDREIKGLSEAIGTTNPRKALMITYDQEDTLEINNKEVPLIPFWKWDMG